MLSAWTSVAAPRAVGQMVSSYGSEYIDLVSPMAHQDHRVLRSGRTRDVWVRMTTIDVCALHVGNT